MFPVHQQFHRPGPAIVIGAHGKPVGAAGQDGQQVVLRQGKAPLQAQEIAGLAHRADHVVVHCRAVPALADRDDVMPGPVQGRPQ